MLKRDSKAGFQCRQVGIFKKKQLWRFSSGRTYTESEHEDAWYRSLLERQQHAPILVMTDSSCKKRWWMFRGDFYWEDDGYSEAEVGALILDKMQQKEKKVQRAMARLSQNGSTPSTMRQPIPEDVRLFVWQRDGGRCVKCGSQENLEYDHIIPLSKGGSNTARNLQLLCEDCNRSKGGNII